MNDGGYSFKRDLGGSSGRWQQWALCRVATMDLRSSMNWLLFTNSWIGPVITTTKQDGERRMTLKAIRWQALSGRRGVSATCRERTRRVESYILLEVLVLGLISKDESRSSHFWCPPCIGIKWFGKSVRFAELVPRSIGKAWGRTPPAPLRLGPSVKVGTRVIRP